MPSSNTKSTPEKGEVISGVDFVLEEGTYIEGVMTLPDGDEATGVVVDFYASDGTVFTSVPDATGTFRYDGLEAGEYIVAISELTTQVGYVGKVTVGSASQQIPIKLSETGGIAGTGGEAGIVVVSFEGVVVGFEVIEEDGSFIVFGVPPGSYDVVAYSANGSSESLSVDVEAGADTEIEVSIQ